MDNFLMNKLINKFYYNISIINESISNFKKKNNFVNMRHTSIIFFLVICAVVAAVYISVVLF